MKKPELLAPVGSKEALVAAINAGCDAVYLSGYSFGARAFAPNFDLDELKEAIDLCHVYGVKVYVTVNTLIKENEVTRFMNYIDFLHQNNVDAIIIQDLGMLDLVRKTYPNLEIHASTQMHIHNLEGVKICEKLGVKRVVLARETSIDLIKEIKKNTSVDLEVFVHGALCISYSGQCLMSSLIGGRSGNRGACAGTCRLPFDIIDKDNKKLNKNSYPLSTKDLFTLDNIDKLIESGIDSFKIEGRMKRAEYVYLVVSLYRKAIDSYFESGTVTISDNDIKELKKIFNRDFTKGFLFNEHNDKITNDYRPNHAGIRIGKIVYVNKNIIKIKLEDDLNTGDGIRIVDNDYGFIVTSMTKDNKKIKEAKKGDIVTLYVGEKVTLNSTVSKTTDIKQLNNLKTYTNEINKKIKVDMSVTLKIGSNIKLELTDGINTVCVLDGSVYEANNAPLDDELITKQLSKLGNTPFILNSISIYKDDNVYVNNKELNEIRRKAVELLLEERKYKISYEKKEVCFSKIEADNRKEVTVLLEDSSLYNQIKNLNVDKIYTDDISLLENDDKRLILKIPRVNYHYISYDKPVMIGEIGSLVYKNIDSSDFSLNVTNSYTVHFLHTLGVKKVTLSYELTLDEIKEIIEEYKKRYNSNPNLELIVFGRQEMMVSKFNLNKLYNNQNIYLKDRYNKVYPIKEKNDLMYIFNSERVNMNIDNLYKIGINSIRFNLFDKKDIDFISNKVKFVNKNNF